MWQFIVEAGLLALDFVYHRWIDPQTTPVQPPTNTIQIPRTDAGGPIPLIYGKYRVRSPALAFTSNPTATTGLGPNPYVYGLNMVFVIGIPFSGGVQQLWNMWVGDIKTGLTNNAGFAYPLVGGGVGSVFATSAFGPNSYVCGPSIQFMDGNSSQVLVDGGGVAQNEAGTLALAAGLSGDNVPGYRGFLAATLFDAAPSSWLIGPTANVPSYSFEVASYPATSLGPNGGKIDAGTQSTPGNEDYDANPVDVIYDILTGIFGKLGISTSLVDLASFQTAATTLYNEGHGYSMSIEGGKSAQDIIKEILAQIDATLYTDPSTNTIKLKLIRPDYNPATIPQITPDNCEALQGFSLGGWQDVPNKVRVQYADRALNYNPNSALAINGSNAIAHGQQEIVVQYPGCTKETLASQLAARELAARSRPLAKCSAIVNREFYAVCPGDAVSVTWPEANISGMIFRVAAVDRGTLRDGKIRLDLIQDYFYQWRNAGPVNPGTTGSFGSGRTATTG